MHRLARDSREIEGIVSSAWGQETLLDPCADHLGVARDTRVES